MRGRDLMPLGAVEIERAKEERERERGRRTREREREIERVKEERETRREEVGLKLQQNFCTLLMHLIVVLSMLCDPLRGVRFFLEYTLKYTFYDKEREKRTKTKQIPGRKKEKERDQSKPKKFDLNWLTPY